MNANISCKTCGTQQDVKDDQTTLNILGNCRRCHRAQDKPRPWQRRVGDMVHYGCYFPTTDLNVSEMGGRGTGQPENVEYL